MDEASIVDARQQAQMASEAVLHQLAISTMPIEASKAAISASNKAARTFRDLTKKLLGSD